jgi:hypothetical protein
MPFDMENMIIIFVARFSMVPLCERKRAIAAKAQHAADKVARQSLGTFWLDAARLATIEPSADFLLSS